MADKMTPPMGVIALFQAVKSDLQASVERDEREHANLNRSISEVKAENQKQSKSLERIERAVGAKTEAGKTKRTIIRTLGVIIAAILTALIGYKLGKG